MSTLPLILNICESVVKKSNLKATQKQIGRDLKSHLNFVWKMSAQKKQPFILFTPSNISALESIVYRLEQCRSSSKAIFLCEEKKYSLGVIYHLHYGKRRIAILKPKPVGFPWCKTFNGHFPSYREFGTSDNPARIEKKRCDLFPNNFQRKKTKRSFYREENWGENGLRKKCVSEIKSFA